MANVMDMFDTFMAAKNVIQCNAITIPARKNLIRYFFGTRRFIFFSFKYMSINTPAMVILYHTKDIASRVMSSPKIAVNPAINTKK